MYPRRLLASAVALACALPFAAKANDDLELEKLRAELQQLKQNYESRIQARETRLQQTESVAGQA